LVQSDEILIAEILKGNHAGYEHLVRKYQNKVYPVIYRMVHSQEDALDLTQETFLQAYRQLSQFRNQANFYTWLYRIATNKTLDFLRKEKSRTEKTDKLVNESKGSFSLNSEQSNPEQLYIQRERQELVQEVIKSLPEKYLITLILNHYQQLSYHEIADILQIPLKTVATRIYRARLLLKEKILKGGDEFELL